ncbi:MAG: permease [Opitutae bacterium]|nr:permease [Opitutae bacterium]
MPVESSTFKKRLKREYRKTVDRLVRSHAFHKLAVKLIYLIGFIISVILGALLYFDK